MQLQSTRDTVTLKTEAGSVRAGEDYSLVSHSEQTDSRSTWTANWRPGVPIWYRTQQKHPKTLCWVPIRPMRDQRNPTWRGDYFVGSIDEFEFYNRALSRAEVALIGAPDDPPGPTRGTTRHRLGSTGRHHLRRSRTELPASGRRNRRGGARNADDMNRLIVDAIQRHGCGQRPACSMWPTSGRSTAICETHAADQWIVLHGDDEDGSETGFHLVQNDGATTICSVTRTPSTRLPTESITWASRSAEAAC